MLIYREESFAPVKAIVRVNGVEEAVACANDNEFGSRSGVRPRCLARAWNVAGRIESGICHVNGPTVHDEAQMPFGGVKASGYAGSAARPASMPSPNCAGSRCRTSRATIHSESGSHSRKRRTP